MLELITAPSPVRTAAAAPGPSAPAAPASQGAAGESPDAQAATPFAAVLQHHLKKAADGKDTKAQAPAADAAGLIAEPLAEPPADAFAILASMLAGIVPVAPESLPAEAGEGAEFAPTGDAGNGTTAGTATMPAITAATPAIAAAMPSVAASMPRSATPETTAAVAADTADFRPPPEQPGVPAAPLASAILAGADAATAERSADNGKNGAAPQGFDALLAATRETLMMAGQNAATHAAPVETAAANVSAIATPVGARGWDREIGEKVTWMIGRQESHADLVLNPPQLGRIEVSVSVNGDQANATFMSANPLVREALESALPRLREVLQDAGISLGQAQVGAESFRQSANNRENGDNPSRGKGGADASAIAVPAPAIAGAGSPRPWLRQGNGMVDTFA